MGPLVFGFMYFLRSVLVDMAPGTWYQSLFRFTINFKLFLYRD